jgi:hypothetical protein
MFAPASRLDIRDIPHSRDRNFPQTSSGPEPDAHVLGRLAALCRAVSTDPRFADLCCAKIGRDVDATAAVPAI